MKKKQKIGTAPPANEWVVRWTLSNAEDVGLKFNAKNAAVRHLPVACTHHRNKKKKSKYPQRVAKNSSAVKKNSTPHIRAHECSHVRGLRTYILRLTTLSKRGSMLETLNMARYLNAKPRVSQAYTNLCKCFVQSTFQESMR